MPNQNIVAYQGKHFIVKLQSNLGSANYGWCLVGMPDAVALAGTENIPLAPGVCGGPVSQEFYFLAMEGGSFQLKFQLLCLSSPVPHIGETPEVKTVTIDVIIYPFNEASNEEIAGSRFVTYNANVAAYKEDNDDFPYCAVLPYGYPYADDQCNLAYGFPMDNQCSLKYGFPMVKYGYPMGEQCNVKYGYPMDDQCNIKYGYPMVKYGYPDCEPCVVKYGYPDCDPYVVKYGYPNCK